MFERSQLELGAPLAAGELCVVTGGRGLIVFAHADGDLRTSARSVELAQRLQRREFSTLLFDLLTPDEAHDAPAMQDANLLAARLEQALQALPPALQQAPVGLFGADAGSAAALLVAARQPQRIGAVVSRGGRPELAESVWGDVRAPTLLLVGAADPAALEPNRRAFARLRCEKRIDVVPRASHLFLEAGTLDVVSQHAGDWFAAHLVPPAAR
ncbi:MAG: alpha/beta hydrolase [Piscinibacter sp.]|nr:alpha/beta hydrolase [Piscinibacter sp.]